VKNLHVVKAILVGMLMLTAGFAPAVVRSQDTGAKQDIKDAGHDTKKAAKKTGSAVKKGTKKAVNKTAEKTGQGADKVQDKTKP